MTVKIKINPEYPHLTRWIESLPDTFARQGTLLIDRRNQVKLVEFDNQKYVVKYFKKISTPNRFIYRYFRASKGERAYLNARILLSKDIATPAPVAFLDVYEAGKMVHSYFVSRYVEFPSAFDLLNRPYSECEGQVKSLAAFLYSIHRKGVFHADLNLTNVLYCPESKLTPYSLIDNNRIRFRCYKRRRAMRNLRRISMPIVNYAALVGEYARLSQQDAYETFGVMMFYRAINREFRRFHQTIKRSLALPGS